MGTKTKQNKKSQTETEQPPLHLGESPRGDRTCSGGNKRGDKVCSEMVYLWEVVILSSTGEAKTGSGLIGICAALYLY